jgi:hypothetical protein
LGRELDALDLIGSCEVERVLKQGPPETTELVRLPGEGAGTRGIRKTFEGDEGTGAAYRVLAEAQKEGRACDRLPRVRAVAEMGATRFVLLDYVEGTTLQKIVEAGPLAPLRALDVTIEICRAAEELHALPAAPLIHRDIKPSNVIVQGDRVTLIDLGIARVWRAGAERDTVRFGTPGFAPPEQYGYGQTSVESDVYAIGMVLAFCLAGRVPDSQERADGFARAGVPEAVRPLVARACSFDPDDRYATVADFRRALEGVRRAMDAPDDTARPAPTDLPPTSYPRTRPSRAARPARLRAGRAARGVRRAGIAWNAILLAWFALSLVASAGNVLAPTTASDLSMPLAARAVQYAGFMGVAQAFFWLPFVYKGDRRSSFPLVGKVSWARGLARCWGLALVATFVTFVLVELLAPGTVIRAG